MGDLKYLFQSIKIGNMKVKNRLVMPAMGINFGGDEDNNVTPQLSEYYAARARGGTGMVITGGAAVSPMGKDIEVQACLWNDRFIPALREMTNRFHENSDAKFGAQLLHGGRQVSGHNNRVAPSPIPALAVARGAPPRELSVDEIKETVETFGDSARRAQEAGFDFVEIHAAHGYLISEFLAPISNKRQDAYGGSFENRILFLLEVLEDIKEKTGPDFPVGVRFNGDDYVEDGWTLEEAKRLAPILEENGADYLHISAGIYGSYPPGITIPSMYGEPGCFVYLAKEIKKDVSVPVITVGRIKDPELADRIIKEGKADMVSMGRAHLADPEIANKAQSGRLLDIRPCIGCCLGCIESIWKHAGATCVMNPELSREYLFMGRDKVKDPRKILVVGAGPAGLAFARTAGVRGHRIIICEEKGFVGGILPIASIPPGRAEFMELVQYYQRELNKLHIEIRLNVKLDNDLIDSIDPDVAVIATGSLPQVPQLEGLFDTKMDIHTALDVLERDATLGDKVIVLGGNQVGLEVADYLSENGKEIVVLNRDKHYAPEMAANDRTYLRERLKKPNVQLYKEVSIKHFLSDGIVFELKGKEFCKEGFEDLVISEGMRSIRHPADLFKNRNIDVHFIGDAKGPRTLLESQTEAYDLGITI